MTTETLSIYKNSYTTLEATINYKPNSSASLTAYDLTSTTATFVLSNTLEDVPLITKTSTNASQILYTNMPAGELEVYINQVDTANLAAGTYYYTLYVDDALGRKFNAITNKIKLRDTVQDV